MSYLKHKPVNPLLQAFVEYYNSFVGDGIEARKFVSLPEGKIGMVFMLNGGSKKVEPDEIIHFTQSHISGLVTKSTNYQLSKDIETFSVVFKPGALFKFVPKIPVHILAKSSANLIDVFGKEIYRIEDKLKKEKDFLKRISIVEDFLLSKIDVCDSRINRAIKYVSDYSNIATVSALSMQLNLGERQLRNIFKEKIGLSPKQYIKLYRFKKSLSNPPRWNQNNAQYAAALGYYDESHFINEFKSFSGMTPSEYFKSQELIADFSNFNRLYVR